MPDRVNHTEEVRAGAPLAVGNVILLPIERVLVYAVRSGRQMWFSGAKEPYALLVREPGGIRVIATSTAAVSLEALREKVSGLDAVLAAM